MTIKLAHAAAIILSAASLSFLNTNPACAQTRAFELSAAAAPAQANQEDKPVSQALSTQSPAPETQIQPAEPAAGVQTVMPTPASPATPATPTVQPQPVKPVTFSAPLTNPAVAPAKEHPPAQSGQPSATAAAAHEPAQPVIGPASYLADSYSNFKMAPSQLTFSDFITNFKLLLSQSGGRSAAVLIKANPVLQEIGARAIDAGAGRIWLFPKVPFAHEVIVNWCEQTSHVSFVGRRHRKVVTHTSSWKLQTVYPPPTVTIKDGHVSGSILILAGDDRGSRLWLKAYRMQDGVFKEASNFFDSVPSFLADNVSGRVGFRGLDLVFNVARPSTSQKDNVTLPEADSSTYRFLLRLTENGYQLDSRLPNEDQFAIVHQFFNLISAGRTDAAKYLVIEPKVVSIPRYIGLKKTGPNFRVAEMAPPPGGAVRFRLVTFGKDDLIFDVGKIKDKDGYRPVIKALFIAPQDSYVSEIAQHLPLYDRTAEAPPPPAEPATDR